MLKDTQELARQQACSSIVPMEEWHDGKLGCGLSSRVPAQN
jgi:hypothetical protein